MNNFCQKYFIVATFYLSFFLYYRFSFLNIKEASCYVHTQGNQVSSGEASARLKVGDASVRGPEDGGNTSADWETQTGGPGQWTDPSHIQVNF